MSAQPPPLGPRHDLQTRLAMLGLVVTPASVGPDVPVRKPLAVPGVSLSETVLRMRREPDAHER